MYGGVSGLARKIKKGYVGVDDTARLFYSSGLLGRVWEIQQSAANNSWMDVAYGNGIYVAVAQSGTGTRVMTSPDGKNWTLRQSAADNTWQGVTFGDGLFVAVSSSGSGNRVMTSPDGINWTIRQSAADNCWSSVTYGNGLFVAVASITGTGNRVMTSPDGINWTLRQSAADADWSSVAYGNGYYVAVAPTVGSKFLGKAVMASQNGINWAIMSARDGNWCSVSFVDGVFLAVAASGQYRATWSSNAVNWTSMLSPSTDSLWAVAGGGEHAYVALSQTGTGSKPAMSLWTYGTPTGAWELVPVPAHNDWEGMCYGNGMLVAVASSGAGNRVMTSVA